MVVSFAVALVLVTGAHARDFVIPLGSGWHYHAEPQAPRGEWTQLEFNDSNWSKGIGAFGYGDDDDGTIIDMRGKFSHVHIRSEFTIDTIPPKMYLHVRYDDAFEAYVNGELVARIGFNSEGAGDHEAEGVEIFPLPTGELKAGRNILAIKGFNVRLNSSDFSLDAGLAFDFLSTEEIGRDSAMRDLALLRQRMMNQSSYLELSDRDPIGALDAVSKSLPDRLSRLDFLMSIKMVIALVGEAHASADIENENQNAQYIPFSLAETEYGVLAVDMRSGEFVDPSFRFVAAIDGIDISTWIETASRFEAQASPQLNRRRALRSVQRLDLLRLELQLPTRSTVSISFEREDGKRREREFEVEDSRPPTARVPVRESGKLPDGIGYLSIQEMEKEFLPEILDWMKKFKNTKALIIDVRGNGGGSYHILRTLAPYFLSKTSDPVVSNLMVYRLAPYFTPDHLSGRPSFRHDDVGWSTNEKAVIQRALAEFQPSWKPPAGKFSDWHFMLLNRKSDRSSRTYFYGQPVAVLMDGWCFSATDGFLSAFAEFPQATLIGQQSAGGSGATREFLLPESDIRVGLSSAASFRPNGEMFDGFGIQADIRVMPEPEDFVGRSDRVLELTFALLKQLIAETRARSE